MQNLVKTESKFTQSCITEKATFLFPYNIQHVRYMETYNSWVQY